MCLFSCATSYSILFFMLNGCSEHVRFHKCLDLLQSFRLLTVFARVLCCMCACRHVLNMIFVNVSSRLKILKPNIFQDLLPRVT